MVLQNDETVVVAFRGTRFQSHTLMDVAELVLIHEDDLWTDSQFLPADCPMGGSVHQGFRDAFSEVSDQLDAVVAAKRPDQQLWLTGHSLGGAWRPWLLHMSTVRPSRDSTHTAVLG